MIDDTFLAKVEDDVARALYQLSSGDAQEIALRRNHPTARYRAPHPVFDLTSSLLKWAVLSGATGMALLPQEQEMELLFDHPGRREHAAALPLKLHQALAARLKDMAGLDVETQDSQQTGTCPAQHEEHSFEIMVVSTPTRHGEEVVLRFRDG